MTGYKTTCPSCGGHNFYVTPENGMKYCFNCGYREFETGEETKPVTRYHTIPAIRHLYTQLAAYYHSCITPDIERYLFQRGITADFIDRWQIGYVPDDRHVLYYHEAAMHAGIATRDYKAFLANRIVVPNRVKNVVTDFRGRWYGDNYPKDKKYLSPYQPAYYRGADFPFNHAALQYDAVVVTEGDFKAIVSHESGVPACALPGILSMRPELRQRADQTFIICFDSQISHGADVKRAIIRLGAMFSYVRVATLPLLGESKQDIDGFIMRHGVSAYHTVINRALSFCEWKALNR